MSPAEKSILESLKNQGEQIDRQARVMEKLVDKIARIMTSEEKMQKKTKKEDHKIEGDTRIKDVPGLLIDKLVDKLDDSITKQFIKIKDNFKKEKQGPVDKSQEPSLVKKEKKSKDENDYNDIWSSIIANDGSVQHLDILDENQKEVFKTSMEIDQRWVVELAADRQQYIDQAQSLNLFFRPNAHIKYIHAIHFTAWKKGVKTLYYCRSEKIGKADKVSKRVEREIIKELDMTQVAQGNDCIACEG